MPAALAKAVSALTTKPYRGVVYRHVPAGGDAVASSYSHSAGGRWNPPGEFGALYTATDEAGIEREMERAAAKRGITAKDLLPRDVVTLSVSLQRVVDLTDPASLRALRISAHELIEKKYKRTWELARALFHAGVEGIIVPSAAGEGKNLVIYSQDLPPKSTVAEKKRRTVRL